MPVSGSNGYRSGIVTLPNRVRIREMDSRTGMYPTISRTGDATRGGNLNIPEFDDTQTIIFQEGVSNLLLGTLLESGSTRSLLPYAGNNNPNGGITGTGNVISGISDNFYMTDHKELTYRNHEEESDPENLGFFDDSRVDLKDSVFYMTGTAEAVYPGFSSRLHDKTQIIIDVTPSEETSAGLINQSSTTDVQDDSTNRQPYLNYYNFEQKKWEPVSYGVRHGGNGTGTARLAHDRMLQSGSLAFGPMNAFFTGSGRTVADAYEMYDDDYYAALFRPVDSFGFPFAMKYHATSSNVLRMSDYISQPFLLEKVVFDIAVKLDAPNDTQASHGSTFSDGVAAYGIPIVTDISQGRKNRGSTIGLRLFQHSLFLMRQFKVSEGIQRTFEYELSSSSEHEELDYTETISDDLGRNNYLDGLFQNLSSEETLNKNRELITYGQSTLIISGADGADYYEAPTHIPFENILSSSIFRDQTILIESSQAQNDIALNFTGSFRIESNCRITPKTDRVASLGTTTSQATLLRSNFGGRMSSNVVSGRSLVNGLPSFIPGNRHDLVLRGNSMPVSVIFPDESVLDKHSPYLLFPEDELVLGYQYPISYNHRNYGFGGTDTNTNKTTFSNHKISKITLFGSLVSNNKEFHDTLNQPLTSEAVHEAIHYNNPVLDQHLVATRNEYSGSYLDTHTTGSVGSTARSLIGSGENVLSGSLQRFVNIKNPLLRYYDTVLPSFVEIWEADGANANIPFSGTGFPENLKLLNHVTGAVHTSHIFLTPNGNHNFYNRVFPFEPRYSNVSRLTEESLLLTTFHVDNKDVSAAFKDLSFTLTPIVAGHDSFDTIRDSAGSIFSVRGIRRLSKEGRFILAGFGSGHDNLYKLESETFSAESSTSSPLQVRRVENPRGFKYGIMNGLPQFSTNIFRSDRYGQFADMLEQGIESRFFIGKNQITQGALTIKFVSDDDENDQYIELNEDQVVSNTFESSNLSAHATSSLPFFDDDTPRNRNYNNIFFSNAVIDIIGFGV